MRPERRLVAQRDDRVVETRAHHARVEVGVQVVRPTGRAPPRRRRAARRRRTAAGPGARWPPTGTPSLHLDLDQRRARRRARAPPRDRLAAATTPRRTSSQAVPTLGWPANGSSSAGVKMRTARVAVALGGVTKVVSERFISLAMACICSRRRAPRRRGTRPAGCRPAAARRTRRPGRTAAVALTSASSASGGRQVLAPRQPSRRLPARAARAGCASGRSPRSR